MKNKFLALGIVAMIGCVQVQAQTSNIPSTVKIPTLVFDKNIADKAIDYDEDRLPLTYKIDRLTVVLGRTTLTDVANILKTSIPLHDGKGYYQCYSIPKYSHQIWFITAGQDFSEPISELVVAKGSPLPTEFCPMITASSYPMFSNKIRLELPEDLINVVLGTPLSKKGEDAVYLYQLPRSGKMKVQTHIGAKGLDKIKITLGSAQSSR